MEDNFKKYRDYTTADFALDEEFIDAIWDPADEKEAYWQEVAITFPQQAKNMEDARLIVKSFYSPRGVISEDIKDRIWQQVTEEARNGRLVNLKGSRKSYWWAVAAVLLVVLGGAWLFWNQETTPPPAAEVVKTNVQNDIAPGGDKAVLTLADGSQIILDSAGNGLIALESNAKVLKLNSGEIAYDMTGDLQTEIRYNSISTPRGGQYQVTLPDGTKVWLNSISSIRFPTAFIGKERRVEVTGEAYFEVAHDVSKPFYVQYSDVSVKVFGTHFNINTYQDEPDVKVTLLEGSVSVESGGSQVVLKPSEQARIGDGSVININKDANLDEVMAWKNGKFLFDRSNITAVMRLLSRWYVMDYEIQGQVSQHFGGSISRDVPVSKVVQMLEMTGAVKISIIGDKLIVSPKK